MTTLEKMLERHQAANLLALQCVLRLGGLMGIGMLSTVRKTLDTYLVCVQRGAESMTQSPLTGSPEQLMTGCVDAMTECVEKSWQDFRNNIQILLLTQDEALIWVARIDRALAAE